MDSLLGQEEDRCDPLPRLRHIRGNDGVWRTVDARPPLFRMDFTKVGGLCR